ncbi:MAG: ABC transporter ATP-binding protein [Candidatus Ranarchaeia archaeon]
MNKARPLLDIKNLCTYFEMSYGTRRAVDGVFLTIFPGDSLGIAGESGCGKSTLAMSILRILPKYAENPRGEIVFKGKNILTLSEKEMQKIRGKEISMVFQEPMTALSPIHRVGDQIIDIIQTHDSKSHSAAFKQAVQFLSLVKIPNPADIMSTYPHQLSGGMRQRVMIAMALACNPSLLILDEPTSALDTVIQKELIDMLDDLKRQLGTTLLLISHNLHLINRLCDKIAIMYLGEIVELASSNELFTNPQHPYSQGLLASIPTLKGTVRKFHSIPGEVPDSMFKPQGCPFHPRCPRYMTICSQKHPRLYLTGKDHFTSCFLYSHEENARLDINEGPL